MRTIEFKVTVTVNDSDLPLSQREMDALIDHITPHSVIQHGPDEDDHFFLETISVEQLTPPKK